MPYVWRRAGNRRGSLRVHQPRLQIGSHKGPGFIPGSVAVMTRRGAAHMAGALSRERLPLKHLNLVIYGNLICCDFYYTLVVRHAVSR